MRVPVPVPCVSAADVPAYQPSAMPEPTADIARKAAGAAVDVRTLAQQNDQMRAALLACAKLKE